jgi:hypothetical protein
MPPLFIPCRKAIKTLTIYFYENQHIYRIIQNKPAVANKARRCASAQLKHSLQFIAKHYIMYLSVYIPQDRLNCILPVILPDQRI